MPCVVFQTKDGLRGIAKVSHRPRRRCSNVDRSGPCTRWASLECDFPSTKKKSGTCDKPLCTTCAVKMGDDLDYCPSHPRDVPPGPAQGGLPL
jgi:hypothetical protein